MAVAHVVSSASHASGSFSTSQTSFQWTHTTTTNPQGVLVFVFQGVSATDAATSVTYGGTNVPAVSGGTAVDTATEQGRVKAFFLGSGVPTTDNPTVVVNRTNNTTTMWAVCVTVTAATDTQVFNPVILSENGAFTQQAVNDGSPGSNSVRYAGAYYGGATPAPAGANSTLLHSNDAGAYGWSAVRETTAGQGSRLVGFTQATADDRAGVHLAIREAQPPSLPGFLDTTWVEPESHCNVKPIIDGNGNRYRVAESNLARGNHPLMGKSSDGGITWAEVDAAGSDARNTQDLEGVWVMKDGTSFIMLTTRDDTVTLDEFRMSDHPTNPDTWGLEETVDTGLSTSGVIQATSIVKLSNGDYQCFYSDLLNGSANQIAFKRRTGTNTYTTKTTFNDGAVNVTAPKAVVGENDVTYVFYKDNTADALVYRTVSSTGTVSARTVVASGTAIASDTIPHTNPIYYDDGGVEVIGIAYINDSDILKYRELRDGVLQTEETISAAALTTNPGATDSQSAVAHLAVDVTTVYAMWSRLSDGDLIKRVRTLGSGWGSESTMWASGGGTGWYIYSDVVTEGTDVKLIYTYDWGTHVDDASNTTYNEEVLRQAGGGTTPISGSDSGNLTVTESGAITVSITASDTGNLTVTETGAPVAKSTTSTDTGNLTVTEAKALDASSTSTDTGNLTVVEAASIVISIITGDSGSLTGTDASAPALSSTGTDTGNLTVTETASSSGTVTASDSGNITVTEAVALALTTTTSDTSNLTSTETGSIVVALTSSDTGDLTSTEVSVSSSTISKADSGDLTVTESAAVLSPLTATDSGNLTAVETPNIEVGGAIEKTGSDSGDFTSTETSSAVVQVNVTDSGTLSATEAPSITGTATASDSGNLTVTEGTSSFRTVVASDSGSLTVTESAVVFNDRPGSDSGTFSATETASIDVLGIVEINASDSGTLSVTESTTLAASTTTSDSGNLTSTEATSFVRNITAGDSGSLTATEGATVALTLSANDSGTISSAEAGSVNTDVGGIDMHIWHDGAMVDATFHYWDGTEYRDLDFHLWNGSSFS